MVTHDAHKATARMTRIHTESSRRDACPPVAARIAGAIRGNLIGSSETPRNASKIGRKPKRIQCVRNSRFRTQEDETSWLADNSTRNLSAQATIGRNSN